jgi:hypothetical protein
MGRAPRPATIRFGWPGAIPLPPKQTMTLPRSRSSLAGPEFGRKPDRGLRRLGQVCFGSGSATNTPQDIGGRRIGQQIGRNASQRATYSMGLGLGGACGPPLDRSSRKSRNRFFAKNAREKIEVFGDSTARPRGSSADPDLRPGPSRSAEGGATASHARVKSTPTKKPRSFRSGAICVN